MTRWAGFSKSLLGLAMLGIFGGATAGVTLDLTAAGSSGGFIDDTPGAVVYRQTSTQPTGTGYIDPFVRVGMQGSAGKDVVSAYNTTVNGVLNNSNEDNWNHEVTYGQMQIQGNGSNAFVRFLLDINQTGSNPTLNLDDVQIFISSSPNQFGTSFVNNLTATTSDGLIGLNGTLVYRMDAPGTSKPPAPCTSDCGDIANDGSNRVSLDFQHGSGSGDLFLDIPVALFNTAFATAGISNGAKAGTFIYLYSKFGSDPFNNNDGFEEWAFLAKVAPPDGPGFGMPEPSSLLLAGLGLLAVVGSRKRQRAAA